MPYLLTLLFFAFVVVFAIIKFRIRVRRAARRQAEARAREREEKERRLLEKVRRIRERDGVAAAVRAVREDPERAVRVVKRMLREKE